MAIDDNTSYELTGYQVKDLASKIRGKVDSSALASVATSGLYSDLTGTPTIPTVYNGTLTIQQNGTTLGTFSANQDTNETINITGGGGGGKIVYLYKPISGPIEAYADEAKTTAITANEIFAAVEAGPVIFAHNVSSSWQYKYYTPASNVYKHPDGIIEFYLDDTSGIGYNSNNPDPKSVVVITSTGGNNNTFNYDIVNLGYSAGYGINISQYGEISSTVYPVEYYTTQEMQRIWEEV